MVKALRVACIQFAAGPDVSQNLVEIEPMIRAAAARGARLILTPENTCHIRVPMRDKLQSARTEGDHLAIPFFQQLAKTLDVYLLIGSLSIYLGNEKMANRSYLFGPDGCVQATYDKIHLFDADLPCDGCYRESSLFVPGSQAVVAPVDDICVGFSICYDLRFPQLYRALAQAGAKILVAPSAYMVSTGKLHWHSLLRTRAIENGAYVIAPAQGGTHQGGRQTYGHSLVVDPWGRILAEKEDDTAGVLMADIDISCVDQARTALPALTHDRPFTLVRYCSEPSFSKE